MEKNNNVKMGDCSTCTLHKTIQEVKDLHQQIIENNALISGLKTELSSSQFRGKMYVVK